LVYTTSMTTDILKSYQALGVSLPENKVALAMSKRWVGQVAFPFIFEAFKYLMDLSKNRPKGWSDDYKNRMQVFAILIYLGSLASYSVKEIMLDGTIDYVDETTKKAVARQIPIRQLSENYASRYANNTDLLRLSMEMLDITGFGGETYDKEALKSTMYGGSCWDDEYIQAIKSNGLTTNHIKHDETATRMFLDILKVIKQEEFQEYMESLDGLPNLETYISVGYDSWDDFTDNYFHLGNFIADRALEMPESGLIRHQETYEKAILNHVELLQILTKIYQCIGFSFTLQKTQTIGVFTYSGTKNGDTVSGIIDQDNHFCQLDTSYTYMGLLRPKVNNQTHEEEFDLIQILRLGKDYYL
jgi:hypothetical protein